MKKWILLLLLTIAIDSPAEDKSVDQMMDRVTVIQKMHDFFVSITELRPYMISPEKFKAPENADKIEAELGRLKKAINEAAHEPVLKTPNYRITRQVLQRHVSDTLQLFVYGNSERARESLNSTMSICMSCHSQMPSESTKPLILEANGVFTQSFDRAEWLFVARSFDKALEIYNNTLRSFPANGATPEQLDASLDRIIAIYARVKRDIPGAKKSFEGDLKNDELPMGAKEKLRSWIRALTDFKDLNLPNPLTGSAQDIKTFAAPYFDKEGRVIKEENSRAATYMVVSGVLNEFLNSHPKTEIAPEILYWLSQCEKEANSQYFYPMTDVYLRQCIIQYPTSSVAPLCLSSYEIYVKTLYAKKMPQSVTKDLQELKSRLKR